MSYDEVNVNSTAVALVLRVSADTEDDVDKSLLSVESYRRAVTLPVGEPVLLNMNETEVSGNVNPAGHSGVVNFDPAIVVPPE